MVVTVISMVLGLGIARLLLGLVTVFRIRHYCVMDWLPLAWAGILFASQLQFWWAINHLPSVSRAFSFADFIFLVMLTMMLFLAAALILPNRPEDEKDGLRAHFERDGRYALTPSRAIWRSASSPTSCSSMRRCWIPGATSIFRFCCCRCSPS